MSRRSRAAFERLGIDPRTGDDLSAEDTAAEAEPKPWTKAGRRKALEDSIKAMDEPATEAE